MSTTTSSPVISAVSPGVPNQRFKSTIVSSYTSVSPNTSAGMISNSPGAIMSGTKLERKKALTPLERSTAKPSRSASVTSSFGRTGSHIPTQSSTPVQSLPHSPSQSTTHSPNVSPRPSIATSSPRPSAARRRQSLNRANSTASRTSTTSLPTSPIPTTDDISKPPPKNPRRVQDGSRSGPGSTHTSPLPSPHVSSPNPTIPSPIPSRQNSDNKSVNGFSTQPSILTKSPRTSWNQGLGIEGLLPPAPTPPIVPQQSPPVSQPVTSAFTQGSVLAATVAALNGASPVIQTGSPGGYSSLQASTPSPRANAAAAAASGASQNTLSPASQHASPPPAFSPASPMALRHPTTSFDQADKGIPSTVKARYQSVSSMLGSPAAEKKDVKMASLADIEYPLDNSASGKTGGVLTNGAQGVRNTTLDRIRQVKRLTAVQLQEDEDAKDEPKMNGIAEDDEEASEGEHVKVNGDIGENDHTTGDNINTDATNEDNVSVNGHIDTAETDSGETPEIPIRSIEQSQEPASHETPKSPISQSIPEKEVDSPDLDNLDTDIIQESASNPTSAPEFEPPQHEISAPISPGAEAPITEVLEGDQSLPPQQIRTSTLSPQDPPLMTSTPVSADTNPTSNTAKPKSGERIDTQTQSQAEDTTASDSTPVPEKTKSLKKEDEDRPKDSKLQVSDDEGKANEVVDITPTPEARDFKSDGADSTPKASRITSDTIGKLTQEPMQEDPLEVPSEATPATSQPSSATSSRRPSGNPLPQSIPPSPTIGPTVPPDAHPDTFVRDLPPPDPNVMSISTAIRGPPRSPFRNIRDSQLTTSTSPHPASDDSHRSSSTSEENSIWSESEGASTFIENTIAASHGYPVMLTSKVNGHSGHHHPHLPPSHSNSAASATQSGTRFGGWFSKGLAMPTQASSSPHDAEALRRDSFSSSSTNEGSTAGSSTASWVQKSFERFWKGNTEEREWKDGTVTTPGGYEVLSPDRGDNADWEFWGKLITEYPKMAGRHKAALHTQLTHGVPSRLRGTIWQLFTNSKNPELEKMYGSLIKRPTPVEKSIRKDIKRTFPKEDLFKSEAGQETLANVLKAYSLYDPEVGYCQGLSFLAGPLVLNMPDEEAFCVIVRMMRNYGLRSYFTPTMSGLQLRLYMFDRLLAQQLPQLHGHLQNLGIISSMYATQWLMTFFAYRFPMPLVFRVFDYVLLEGTDALLKFGIALMKRFADDLIKMEFEQALEFLKNDVSERYISVPSEFTADAMKVEISTRDLEKWRKEYESSLDPGHVLTIHQLKARNAELKKKVRTVEESMGVLNEEHVQLANELVSAKLKMQQVLEMNDMLTRQVTGLKEILSKEEEVKSQTQSQTDVPETGGPSPPGEGSDDWESKYRDCKQQLEDMEGLLIEAKMKYAESENERCMLGKKLDDLRKALS